MKLNFKISSTFSFLGIKFLFAILSFFAYSCSSKSYTRQGIIENFNQREKEILAIADYFRKQKPNGNEVLCEVIDNRYTISIGLPYWGINQDHPNQVGIAIKINSAKMDTLLRTLGWTAKTVMTLKDMLIKANCQYISSDGDYIHLHYGTDDLTSWWYIISKEPFPDSIIESHTKLGINFLRKNVRIGTSSAL